MIGLIFFILLVLYSKYVVAGGQDMFAIRENRFYGSVRRDGDVIGGFAIFSAPLALDFSVNALVLARGVSYMSASLGGDDVGIIIRNLDATHFTEEPFANSTLRVVV